MNVILLSCLDYRSDEERRVLEYVILETRVTLQGQHRRALPRYLQPIFKLAS